MARKIIVIGSGFAGLSAACFMAKAGWEVVVLEKHLTPGGRARQLREAGFTFDMGPSWYWMPEIFERFFNAFQKCTADYYTLHRLDPSYRVYTSNEIIDISADYGCLKMLFEQIEQGSAKKLDAFLKEAYYKYRVGMHKLAYKPGRSISEFMDWDILAGIFRLDVFTSMKTHVAKYFKNPLIQQLLEFPVLFLGAMPAKIPALYSLMNYADIKGGTWYPAGGMYSIVLAMYNLALELGVKFYFGHNVKDINIENDTIKKVVAVYDNDIAWFNSDAVIAAADYHHVEKDLLPGKYRSYSDVYWDKRIMAPSCLLYYIGLGKRLDNMVHHSLFFDASFEKHGKEIYETKQWPSDPLFYMSATSVTDNTVAPPGCENLFFLVPAAAGLEGDTEDLREYYFEKIVKRVEKRTRQRIREHIIHKKTFAHSDFVHEYNSFKGNAYGLANTLLQTAILKPSCRSKKVKNLFFAGQLTVPGPGVPPGLISGEIAATEVLKAFRKSKVKS